MPNRPVRDKWDYSRKMERHFPIKPRQPIRNSSCHFLSFPNSLIRAKNRFVKIGTANFDRNIPTEISGPPPKVIPNIPVGRNRNRPFHLNSDRNFRNLWHNGKHPRSVGSVVCDGSAGSYFIYDTLYPKNPLTHFVEHRIFTLSLSLLLPNTSPRSQNGNERWRSIHEFS